MAMQKILKIEQNNFVVEFETTSVWDDIVSQDFRMQELERRINDVDAVMEKRQQQIDKLNDEIDRLTNHADGVDYMVAVVSGLITGLIDSFVVGEWNFASAKAKSNREINEKVMEFAKKKGYSGDRLDGAIAYLEKKFRLPGDGAYQLNPDTFINAKTHHLDDFCHHPTLVGLICNVLVQFTGESIYVNKNSEMISLPVTVNEYGQFQGNNVVTKLFCGVINWFMNAARAMANGYGHWMSDIAGSSSAQKGGGAGLPGPLMSMLKELSSLPIFKDSGFGEQLRRAFQNGIGPGPKQVDLGAFNSLFEGASSKLDMRTEMAVFSELKRQALPVVINEVIVRGFYFIRRFMMELKDEKKLSGVNWRKVMPFNNRTIVRMMTIASGTFTAFDVIDAAIRASIKSGGSPIALADILLRVNFVGVGRFAIAVFSDVKMGVEKKIAEGKVEKLEMDQLKSLGVKLYYCQEECWVMVDNCLDAYKELVHTVENTMAKQHAAIKSIEANAAIVAGQLSDVAKNDPKFAEELLDDLF